MSDFKREALPHDIDPYRAESQSIARAAFQRKRPYPFLIYARSKLWDPTLLAKRPKDGSWGGDTKLVSYEFVEGGWTFLHPVRKRQTDPASPTIVAGRAISNDLILPVASVSSRHCFFMPPQPEQPLWTVTDLGSSNGTWLNEDKLTPHDATPVKDGEYLRLGGNLIAWFVYPGRMHTLLKSPEELKKFTDL